MNHSPGKRPSIARWIVILLGSIFGCLALLVIGLWAWVKSPHYIDLPIPAPQFDWDYTERTVQTWEDNRSRYFIVRRETTVAGGACYPEYLNWGAVAEYFDAWLTNHGWTEYGDSWDTPCNLFLPESEFLSYGENGYRVYKHANAEPYTDAPTVCLAIWAVRSTGDAYHVVLITGNPSPLTILRKAVD